MPNQKSLAIVLIEGFADWEYPLLAASARQWFGIETRYFTPEGTAVTSIGGLRFTDGTPVEEIRPQDFDAIAIIGSDNWTTPSAPDISKCLGSFDKENKTIGGICAGTMPLAKVGIFEDRQHTSNGLQWIGEKVGNYLGADHYQDVPYAVRHEQIISAPGSAPGTFAIKMLSAILPDKVAQLSQMHTMFAQEYQQEPI